MTDYQKDQDFSAEYSNNSDTTHQHQSNNTSSSSY